MSDGVIKVRDARFDTTFKILFLEEPTRTAAFLNAVLNLRGEDAIVKVKFLDSSFDLGIEVECATANSTRFIVEMQRAHIAGHTNRWICYGARELMRGGRERYERASSISLAVERRSACRKYYAELYPVKVLTILDHDSVGLARELRNGTDVVVHWNIREETSGDLANNLLSWSFAVLPRFVKLLEEYSDIDFRGNDASNPWLYLLTREDKEEVPLSDKITGGDDVVKAAFLRLSSLNDSESDKLLDDINMLTERTALERQQFEEGKAVGIEEGKAVAKAVGIEQGKAVGIEEGKELIKEECAIRLLGEGVSVEIIKKVTGVDPESLQATKAAKSARGSGDSFQW